MANEQTLESLEKREYSTILREKNGLYYFLLPDLGIIAQADSADQAYINLKNKKNEFFNEMIKLNTSQYIPLPSEERGKKYSFRDFQLNLTQAFITVGVLFFFLGIGIGIGKKVIKRSFHKKIESIVNATPEKRTQRLKRLEKNLKILKPYIDQAQKTLSE